ncbi:hypothetical protein J3R80_15650 [Aliiroseovarius sp. Z3]|nr:hypothetical protein [Aliiroseovarius sp. Z3]
MTYAQDTGFVLLDEPLNNLDIAASRGLMQLLRKLAHEHHHRKQRNDGIGIPLDQADTAFRRFSQLRNGTGSGLGLAIVEQVLTRHQGSVALTPAENGTCVRMSLPLEHPPS